MQRRILHVVGARPNFMKVAPIARALRSRGDAFAQLLVHTGQHYDVQMSDVFFRELELPAPDVNLEVGSGTHASQTAHVMLRLEPVVTDWRPDWVLVVGDVNSTLAGALVCAKLGVRVAHVEAGLRSFDRGMPEELNRVLTDQLADLLFTSEDDAAGNLLREGIPQDRIRFVGNVMIDTLLRLLPRTESQLIVERLGLTGADQMVLVTLHRPSNVDAIEPLREIAAALGGLARRIRVVFPVHPRTRVNIDRFDLGPLLEGCALLEPLGYLDFLALERRSSLVITDSGGVQEETTALGVPCLTIRPNTERPVTITQGTNRLVRCERETILAAADEVLSARMTFTPRRPALWDGRAAERIVRELETFA